MYDKLSKMVERFGEESLNVAFTREDHMGKEGTTAKGKDFYWATNNGTERRSWYCGSLWIEGMGMVFTSGTVAKAMEYLLAKLTGKAGGQAKLPTKLKGGFYNVG